MEFFEIAEQDSFAFYLVAIQFDICERALPLKAVLTIFILNKMLIILQYSYKYKKLIIF
jgi:hypothetical protein